MIESRQAASGQITFSELPPLGIRIGEDAIVRVSLPAVCFDTPAPIVFHLPQLKDRPRAEQPEALDLWPDFFMCNVILASINRCEDPWIDAVFFELCPTHFHEDNHRIRERGVGSNTISSGVPRNRPEAANAPATCCVTGMKSLSKV